MFQKFLAAEAKATKQKHAQVAPHRPYYFLLLCSSNPNPNTNTNPNPSPNPNPNP